jgi:hypothetical protein
MDHKNKKVKRDKFNLRQTETELEKKKQMIANLGKDIEVTRA